MFVKMTVIVVTVHSVMKCLRATDDMAHCFANTQHLQGLFAADAGARFKITLQCACGNTVMRSKIFDAGIETIIDHCFLQDLCNNIDRLQ